MATKKKLLQAAAGNAGGAGLDVDEVFSTYLYDGTSSAQTITNGIDLAGEGGLVWMKNRTSSSYSHALQHTTIANGGYLSSNNTNAFQAAANNGISAFNSNGFTFDTGNWEEFNNSSHDYASWTFRKAPKFFDVVTYTGDGTSNRQIPHSIDGPVGFILIKSTSGTGNWLAWHRSVDPGYGILDLTLAFTSGSNGFLDAVADTYFETSWLNTSGVSYVAYLFAHNNNDGEFGPDSDQDIIKCGSYTGDGGAGTTEVDLGFEPQWILVKASSAADSWFVIDNMRGWATHNNTANDAYLLPNATNAESTGGFLDITSTGFKTTLYSNVNVSGRDYIYIAIRRGPLSPAETATELFDVVTRTDSGSNTQHTVGFAPDVVLDMSRPLYSFNFVYDRLRGGKKYLATNATSAEGTFDYITFDDETGKFTTKTQTSGGITFVDYVWKRAPNFFDVVAYSGNYTARTINHNLGAVPEMMWVKNRSGNADWTVYHKDLGATKYIEFKTYPAATNSARWNNTAPTSSVFTLGDHGNVNATGDDYIAYLFASLAGISKVGSVTHSGTTNVDCGFSAGSRFVLLKRTDATGDWYIWDSTRGIVSGNDPYLLLNTTAAEVTNTDYIDPLSSGFTITSSFTAGDYIFYAIA